jgi:hypothetical protein
MYSQTESVMKRVVIHRSVIIDMLEVMRKFGAQGWEVLVLWLGHIDSVSGVANVVRAFVPKQNPIAGEDGVGYFVESDTLFPREAFHSEADDRYAIVTTNGGLSLVVPNFGHATADPTAWAVFRLHGRDWRQLKRDDVGMLIQVRDGQWA